MENTSKQSVEVEEAARYFIQCAGRPRDTVDIGKLTSALTCLYSKGHMTNLAPVLPLLLKIKGKPFSLKNHFVLEPLFSMLMSKETIIKGGRQFGKSTTCAAQMVMRSACIPHFDTLYVAPRYEQTRLFSSSRVRPFLSPGSLLGKLMTCTTGEGSVLQRTMVNGSSLHFSFAYLDADRICGLSSSCAFLDEVADIDPSLFDVIFPVLDASDYGIKQFTGTPKTTDNILQELWEKSSQAEWVTPCLACKHWNIASVNFDLLGMIQRDGLSCASCGRRIDAELGHWEHAEPSRQHTFPGWHVPQPIMPMHYRPNQLTGDMRKWAALWDAKNNMNKTGFYNQKLGESCDVRLSLLTRHDLIQASDPRYTNDFKAAVARKGDYQSLTLGVDWGGGGEDGLSSTKLAVLGHRPDGSSDCLFGENVSTYARDAVHEAKIVIHRYQAFGCSLLAHDFGGAGALRETLLIQAGFPIKMLFPVSYTMATAADMVTYKPPSAVSTRWYYSVDKARSLMLLCQIIKHRQLRFPAFESWRDLADDFLALVEDIRQLPRQSDIFLISRKKNQSDDFVHAINLACLAHWHSHQRYPNLASVMGIKISPEQEAALRGESSPREGFDGNIMA